MKYYYILLFYLILTIFFTDLVYATQTYLNESNRWGGNLTAAQFSSLAFGDIDNDGDLDLALTGQSSSGNIAKVYLNNGTSFVENQTWQQNLTYLNYGSFALGDIDNDGDLDLALSGCSSGGGGLSAACNEGGYQIFMYINNGTSFVENQTWQQNLTKSWKGSLAFGDIDNDGDLDLALTGQSSSGNIAKVYLNNGTSFVENQTWQQNLTGVYESSVALGDVDNDGDLDLALCGDAGISNEITKIYVNNGTSLIENQTWQVSLLGVDWCSLTLGDYDNDKDLDFSLIGHATQDNHRIYRNNGSSFTEINREISGSLVGIFAGSLTFADYDIDGYLDLIATGNEGYTTLYLYNVTDNNFTTYSQDPESHMLNLEKGSTLSWTDIDNDTDLDLVLAGYLEPIDPQITIYINNRSLTRNNTLPQPPNSSFSASYSNNQLTLSWGNGSDNETPTAGLYYNLRLGTTSAGNQIISGVYGGSSNPTAGYFGNIMQRRSITLGNERLQANTTYYWSVQTIDTGLAKSSWSVEQNFTLATEITAPSITINFPDDNNYTSFSNVTFNVTVSDNINVSNVSLYGSWGGWHRNQTNSSGINGTDYIFQANLSAYGEGSYTWAIHSCDTTNNCIFSVNRTVIRDLSYPIVYLESPVNSSSWIDNNSVTFSFNVTDLGIANCSLVVGSSLKYNFTSITLNTSTSATVTLDNGNYNWSVNCTDMLLRQNSSETRSLTVNYQAPSTPTSTGAGGGGGGGPSYTTYSVGELKEAQEVNKELGKGDKIKFNLTGQEHNLTLKKVTLENAIIEINLSVFNFTLTIGESKKFNLSNAEFYDLLVKLNNIKFFKANLTIMAIHEQIYVKPVEEEEEKPEKKPEKEIKEGMKSEEMLKEKLKFWQRDFLLSILSFGLFLLLILVILLTLKKIKQLSRELSKQV